MVKKADDEDEEEEEGEKQVLEEPRRINVTLGNVDEFVGVGVCPLCFFFFSFLFFNFLFPISTFKFSSPILYFGTLAFILFSSYIYCYFYFGFCSSFLFYTS